MLASSRVSARLLAFMRVYCRVYTVRGLLLKKRHHKPWSDILRVFRSVV